MGAWIRIKKCIQYRATKESGDWSMRNRRLGISNLWPKKIEEKKRSRVARIKIHIRNYTVSILKISAMVSVATELDDKEACKRKCNFSKAIRSVLQLFRNTILFVTWNVNLISNPKLRIKIEHCSVSISILFTVHISLFRVMNISHDFLRLSLYTSRFFYAWNVY